MKNTVALLLAVLSLDAAEPGSHSWPQVDQPIVISVNQAPKLGAGDFSITVWARADVTDRITGDLVSQYDARKRRGFHLTLKCNPGVTSSVANWKH